MFNFIMPLNVGILKSHRLSHCPCILPSGRQSLMFGLKLCVSHSTMMATCSSKVPASNVKVKLTVLR